MRVSLPKAVRHETVGPQTEKGWMAFEPGNGGANPSKPIELSLCESVGQGQDVKCKPTDTNAYGISDIERFEGRFSKNLNGVYYRSRIRNNRTEERLRNSKSQSAPNGQTPGTRVKFASLSLAVHNMAKRAMPAGLAIPPTPSFRPTGLILLLATSLYALAPCPSSRAATNIPAAAVPGQIALHNDWQIQSSAKVTEAGSVISRTTFKPK